MATHSSILAWRIPRTEEPGGLHSPQGHKQSDMTEGLTIINEISIYLCLLTVRYSRESEVPIYSFAQFSLLNLEKFDL